MDARITTIAAEYAAWVEKRNNECPGAIQNPNRSSTIALWCAYNHKEILSDDMFNEFRDYIRHYALEYHRNLNTNALYIRLYREDNLENFLHSAARSDEYERLNDHDKQIAKVFTDHEDGIEWDDQPIDYESAIEKLIGLFDANPGHYNVRWCDACGEPFYGGYFLGGSYACSDECRDYWYIHLQTEKPCYTSEDAHRQYLIDCYNINDRHIEGLTADEIEELYHGAPISDEYLFTSTF